MRSEIIRLYKTVHTWTGILTGLALFIAFYAGALTVFEGPLGQWLAPPGQYRPTPLAASGGLIERVLAARPEAGREFTLHLDGPDPIPARLTWQKGRDDSQPWSAELEEDGTLRLVRLAPPDFPNFVDTVHRTAGIPGDQEIGEHFMGVVSVLYAVALVSGLIVVLPALVKDFLALRLGANLKRLWLDAHNLVGVVSLPFHLVMAMTAVIFAFHDHIYDLQDAVVYGGRLKPIMRASNPLAGLPKDVRPAAMLPPEALLARAQALNPGFRPLRLQYREAGTGSATVRIIGEDPRYLLRNKGFLLMHAVSGEVLNTDYFPGRQQGWNAVVSSFFALHFASYGGDTVRWSYLFLGLAGAFLFYSGNLLWIETRRRSERRHGPGVAQTRSSRWLAAGTVGVCLGCIAGFSLAIAAGKVLQGRVSDPGAWQQGLYYTVFLASLAWAFHRGGARGGVDLTRLAALCSAAIPVTSLLALALPGLGLWANGGGALGVDAVAAVGALALFRVSQLAARRSRQGPADSVWSASSPPAATGP